MPAPSPQGDQPFEVLFVLWWLATAFLVGLAIGSYRMGWALIALVAMLSLGYLADVAWKGRFSGGAFPFSLITNWRSAK